MFFALVGCTNLQRLAHVYVGNAPEANVFHFKDGGSAIYYTFTIDDNPRPDTFVFFYGGSGCPSWKYVMPNYIAGLDLPSRVFVLNKRHVSDRSTGMFGCGEAFHLSNNPEQWVADYAEFIRAQFDSEGDRPKRFLLVGVSEGSQVAARVAGMVQEVTHLAIIGSGGYTMRRSLVTLKEKGAIGFNVETGWQEIASDPRSIDKNWFGNRYRWWTDVMDLDPLPYYFKLNIPIMVGVGEQDESVPVESARHLEAKFREAGKTNLKLTVYPAADHRLQAGGTDYRREFFGQVARMMREQKQ
ncbi:MAG: alpha/beta hydrolase [Desulfuromonadaceae bacterium]|nr:alpha/beta hydrolase [Desulfuromonadaceae bacterium]